MKDRCSEMQRGLSPYDWPYKSVLISQAWHKQRPFLPALYRSAPADPTKLC